MAVFRNGEGGGQQRPVHPLADSIGDRRGDQRRAHHIGQRRVPGAGDIEKGEDARGIDHVGQRETGTEHDSDEQSGKKLAHLSLRSRGG